MTEEERMIFRIEHDIPEPESTHWLSLAFLLAPLLLACLVCIAR